MTGEANNSGNSREVSGDFGAVLYEMPIEMLDRVRLTGALLALSGGFVLAVIVLAIVLVALPRGITWQLIALLIPIPFVVLVTYFLAQPVLRNDQLVIYERGIRPLRKPLFAPRGQVLGLGELKSIARGILPGHENEEYVFGIDTKSESRYVVASQELRGFDLSDSGVSRAYDALMRLRQGMGES